MFENDPYSNELCYESGPPLNKLLRSRHYQLAQQRLVAARRQQIIGDDQDD